MAGTGADLMLTDAAGLNIYHGGDGDDWIVDASIFVSYVAGSFLPVRQIAAAAAWIDDALDPLEAVVDTVADIQEILERFDPLKYVESALAPSIAKLKSAFDLSTNQFIGGAGNDVIGAGDTGGDLVGGAGNDTYLFTFGSRGEHDIDEAGLDAARDWAGRTRSDAAREEAQANAGGGAAGGADVIELRGFGGLVDISADNLAFASLGGRDLVIGLRTAGGTTLDFAGHIRVKNMDEAATRVETLRIVTSEGSVEYDIGRAWQDGELNQETWTSESARGFRQVLRGKWPEAWTDDAVDLSPYLIAETATRGAQAIFDDRVEDWLGQVRTAFEHIPGARNAFRDAEALAGDIVRLAEEAPDEMPGWA